MLKRLFSLGLIGLISVVVISCATTNPHIDDVRTHLQKQDFKAALQSADMAIEEEPENPTGYYYKAVVLGELAQSLDDPEERVQYYEEMNDLFDRAEKMYAAMEEPPSEAKNLVDAKTTIWGMEHNTAIQYATDDSLMNTTDQPFERAIQHMKNAIMIRPDSTLSWDVLSQIYQMNDDMAGATDAMKETMKRKNPPPVDDFARLADLQRIQEDIEGAVKTLEKAFEVYPDTVSLRERLADAYMANQQQDKSIALIEDLVESDPANPQYRLALGTQYYQIVLQRTDQIKANFDRIDELRSKANNTSGEALNKIRQEIKDLESRNDQYQQEIDNYTDLATAELETVIEYRPDDPQAYNTLGIIYQNKAAALFEERNRTTDNKKAAALDSQARENLREAMKYYESAAEADPDNPRYWEDLFRIYTTLGMDEKAEEAMKKAGFDDN